MNLFEAGILPSIPLGSIVGGILCKPFGILAIIGGAVGGGIVGLLAGWLYGFLLIILMMIFTVPWKAIRRHPDPFEVCEEEQEYLVKSSTLGIILGITASGVLGIWVSWLHGLLVFIISTVFTAFMAVIRTRLHFKDKTY